MTERYCDLCGKSGSREIDVYSSSFPRRIFFEARLYGGNIKKDVCTECFTKIRETINSIEAERQ